MIKPIQTSKGWTEVLIKDISSQITKGSTPSTYGHSYQNRGIKFLRAENVHEHKLKLMETKHISKETNQFFQRSIIQPKNVLITIAGTIGRASFVPDNSEEMNCNQAVAIIKLNERCNPQYLSYFLNSYSAKKQIEDFKITSSISNLSLEMIGNIKIPLPSHHIQKNIIKKLDNILSQLEKKKKKIVFIVEQNKKRITFFEKNWLTYIFDREIQTHPKRKEWSISTLEELPQKGNDKFTDGPFGSNLKVSDYTTEGIPIIRLQNIRVSEFINKNLKFTSEKKYNQLVRHSALPGDVLIAKMADPVARSTIIPPTFEKYMISADCVKLRINEEKAIPEFVSYAINSYTVRNQAISLSHGMTRLRINLREIKKLKIPLPPLPLQKKIIQNIKFSEEKFQSQKVQFENIKQNYENIIKHINHLELSIVDVAFSGKLIE